MINKLEDLDMYQLSMEIGDSIWNIFNKWPYIEKDTLGKQMVRATDSIALNIAEGFGRYHYKEFRNFCFYSRGSVLETKCCITKAKARQLINNEEYLILLKQLERVHMMLNKFIKTIGNSPT